MNNIFANILSLTLIVFMLQGCLSIPSNRVKLEKLPEAKSVKGLNIKVATSPESNWVYELTDKGLRLTLQKNRPDLFKPQKDGCSLKINSYLKTYYNEKFDDFYMYFSAFTFYIFPYYYPKKVGTKAALINAKTGKVLKEYLYVERASEIVSLPFYTLMIINPLSYILPAIRDNVHTPEAAVSVVRKKTEEALIRQVTNDAYEFKECLK